MKACILVACGSDPDGVANTLRHHSAVYDAFPVGKRHEVVVRAEVRGMGHLAELLDRVSAIEGVIVSETLLEIPQVVNK